MKLLEERNKHDLDAMRKDGGEELKKTSWPLPGAARSPGHWSSQIYYQSGGGELVHLLNRNFGQGLSDGDNDDWCLEEEFQAWAEADEIMKGLDLYNLRYLAKKHECLLSYYSARETRNRIEREQNIMKKLEEPHGIPPDG